MSLELSGSPTPKKRVLKANTNRCTAPRSHPSRCSHLHCGPDSGLVLYAFSRSMVPNPSTTNAAEDEEAGEGGERDELCREGGGETEAERSGERDWE
jgi:hypothetical protein